MKVMYILLLVILIAGCTQFNSNAPLSESDLETNESSYVDYINIEDKQYINAWELLLVNTEIVGIGEVERGSVIPKGTPVYEIPGYPEHDVVAVKADSNNTGLVTNLSGYLIYVLHGQDGKSHYPKIQDQQVNQIKIFRESKLLRELNGEDVNSFLDFFNQQGPHNEFEFEKEPEYTVQFIVENALGLNYGIMEKDGVFGLAHIESKLPDEIAHYFK